MLLYAERSKGAIAHIALAGELEQTLENLPGVQYARVHFAMPEGSGVLTSKEERQPPQRAAVVLKVQEKLFQLTPKDVQSLVAGSLPKIAPGAVSVVVQLAPPVKPGKGAYTTLGPFTVSPSTKVPLLITFVLMLLLVAGLVITVFLTRRSLAKARGKGDGVDDGPTVTT